MHEFFPYLRDLCRVLEKHDISYCLSGGTLLGAVRDGEMIPHDYDFDIDCFARDQQRILELSSEFAEKNLTLKTTFLPKKTKVNMIGFHGKPISDAERSRCMIKVSDATTGKPVGDIFIFAVFNDGIARRYDFSTNSYVVAKLSIPAWYYESPVTLRVSGEPFKVPRNPELIVQKMYGSDWRTPKKKGEYGPGRQVKNGQVIDADVQALILNALENGWDDDYSTCPKWPPEEFFITRGSAEWAMAREPMCPAAASSFLAPPLIDTVANEKSSFRISQYLRYCVGRAWHSRSIDLRKSEAQLRKSKDRIKLLEKELSKYKTLAKARAIELKELQSQVVDPVPRSMTPWEQFVRRVFPKRS